MGPADAAAEADVVEQEELRLWPEQHGIRDAGGAQEVFGAFGDGARVAIVACMVPGSRMSQRMISVGSSKNGSRTAVLASGISTMSDSLMPFQPPIEEPSNILPSSKKSAFTVSRDSHVLFLTLGVSETQVYEFHFMLIQHRQNVFSGHT